jgi:hypothetical protein
VGWLEPARKEEFIHRLSSQDHLAPQTSFLGKPQLAVEGKGAGVRREHPEAELTNSHRRRPPQDCPRHGHPQADATNVAPMRDAMFRRVIFLCLFITRDVGGADHLLIDDCDEEHRGPPFRFAEAGAAFFRTKTNPLGHEIYPLSGHPIDEGDDGFRIMRSRPPDQGDPLALQGDPLCPHSSPHEFNRRDKDRDGVLLKALEGTPKQMESYVRHSGIMDRDLTLAERYLDENVRPYSATPV